MTADIIKLFAPPTRLQQLNSEIMLLEELGQRIVDEFQTIEHMRVTLRGNADVLLVTYRKALQERAALSGWIDDVLSVEDVG